MDKKNIIHISLTILLSTLLIPFLIGGDGIGSDKSISIFLTRLFTIAFINIVIFNYLDKPHEINKIIAGFSTLIYVSGIWFYFNIPKISEYLIIQNIVFLILFIILNINTNNELSKKISKLVIIILTIMIIMFFYQKININLF